MIKTGVVLFTFFFTVAVSLSPSSPDRYLKRSPPFLRSPSDPQKYVEVTRPLPSDHLTPSCSHTLVRHSFANTIGGPPLTVPYSPPPSTSPPWSHVVLELAAASSGDQYDRISGLWLGGVELLRTSTAEPTPDGIFWKVRKDVTRYSSLFMRSDLNVTMMLENVVNEIYTGIYHINVTLLFYEEKGARARVPSSLAANKKLNGMLGFKGIETRLGEEDQSPADLIIPVCDSGRRGFWFMIESESDVRSKSIQIPRNTRRIVLELYVSYHGNDEFWYSNPPDAYIKRNNLPTGRGNGAYREVFLMIDGRYVGSEVPFPVIFTGGINPLFWGPVVSIGAFNLPSYDLDLTPFLGLLLDGKAHEFGIGVKYGISYWLVDANLHLWLDHSSSRVEAKPVAYYHSDLIIERHGEFELLDGSFRIKAERKSRFEGWVKSREGNLTTIVSNKFEFSNLIRFEKSGTYKGVKQRVQAKKIVELRSQTGNLVSRVVHKRRYPLDVFDSTLPGLTKNKDIYLLVTNVSHALNEKYCNGDFSSSVFNSQNSDGWMEVEDHSVLAGEASTTQTLNYIDEYGCYSRTVAASNGEIVKDNSTFSCVSAF